MNPDRLGELHDIVFGPPAIEGLDLSRALVAQLADHFGEDYATTVALIERLAATGIAKDAVSENLLRFVARGISLATGVAVIEHVSARVAAGARGGTFGELPGESVAWWVQ